MPSRAYPGPRRARAPRPDAEGLALSSPHFASFINTRKIAQILVFQANEQSRGIREIGEASSRSIVVRSSRETCPARSFRVTVRDPGLS